jgi:hypothetical protein
MTTAMSVYFKIAYTQQTLDVKSFESINRSRPCSPTSSSAPARSASSRRWAGPVPTSASRSWERSSCRHSWRRCGHCGGLNDLVPPGLFLHPRLHALGDQPHTGLCQECGGRRPGDPPARPSVGASDRGFACSDTRGGGPGQLFHGPADGEDETGRYPKAVVGIRKEKSLNETSFSDTVRPNS